MSPPTRGMAKIRFGTDGGALESLRNAIEACTSRPLDERIVVDAHGRCSACGRRTGCGCKALHDARTEARTGPRALRLERVRHALELVTEEDRDLILAGRLGEDPRAREAWARVSTWLELDSPFLVLQGEQGSGKTCAVLGAVGELGGRVVGILDVVRAWRNETPEAQALRDVILGVPFLVVEDVGTEREEEIAAVALHAVVDRRQSRRRTAITTNLDRPLLEARYDPRTLARLDHSGVWCSLRTKNLRRGRPS
jgi:hypothetical protein